MVTSSASSSTAMTDTQHEPSSSSSPVPSTSSTLVSSSPTSTWHAIRPWLPPLTLSVREVTSVSVTFLLSATITQSPELDIDLDLENELGGEDQTQPQHSIISEALAKGLSVKVNGSPWQRVFIRIDESADEAVIIIYGLMPGRQYDIDLGIVHSRRLNRQITTEDADSESSSPSSPTAPAITPVTSNSTAIATTSVPSQNATDSTANPPAPPPFTIEDRLAQLNHTLSLLTTERESLQSQIKTVRRDGQKADAALRSEIEALKRASEKHTAAEARAKQKILALQEAVKRAQAGAHATEEQLAEIESCLPALLEEKEKKEAEYERIKKAAERVRRERESADEKDKKRLEKLRAELSTLSHKLEKLNGKREKMEGTILPDLEEQLKQTRKELESLEKEEEELAAEELASVSGIGINGQESSLQGFSRKRANTGGALSNPGLISRPQRAPDFSSSMAQAPAVPFRPWDPISLGPRDSPQVMRAPTQTQTRQDSRRSSGGCPYPPGLGPLNASDPLHSSSPSSSSSNSPVGTHPSGSYKITTSPLSSRAPVFEPLRNAPYVAPIQRPSGATVTRSKSGASAQSRHA